jgi:hypothetical protein
MSPRRTASGSPLLAWAAKGAGFGAVAGVAMAAFAASASWLVDGRALLPARAAAGIVLGERAVEAGFSAAAAVGVGTLVHLTLAAAYGMVFAVLAAALPDVRRSLFTFAAAGAAFGLGLWVFNHFLVAPLAFPWFADLAQPAVAAAHGLVYGPLLGVLLALRHPALAYVAEGPGEHEAADEPLSAERGERASRTGARTGSRR